MTVENPTIQEIINLLLLIIPAGAAVRIMLCAAAMIGDEEKRGENKQRIINVLKFVVVAQLGVAIINGVFFYYK